MCSPKLVPLFILIMSVPPIAMGKEPLPNNKYEDGITLTITSKPFDPKAHKLSKCKEMMLCQSEKNGQPEYYMCNENLCSVDGKPLYGANGKIPKQQVTSLIFEKNGKKVALDVSNMYNPNVNNANIKKYIKVMPGPENSYQVTGYFSHDDGDDSMYICLWQVSMEGSFRNYMGDFGLLHDLTERVAKDFNYKTLETLMRENQRK